MISPFNLPKEIKKTEGVLNSLKKELNKFGWSNQILQILMMFVKTFIFILYTKIINFGVILSKLFRFFLLNNIC
jgi:hypothetical protein